MTGANLLSPSTGNNAKKCIKQNPSSSKRKLDKKNSPPLIPSHGTPEIHIFCELPMNPTLKPIMKSINHSFLPPTEGQPLIRPSLNALSAMSGQKTSVFNFLQMPINDALNRRLYRQVKNDHSQSGIIKNGERISSTWTSKNSNPQRESKCFPKCHWKIQQTLVS
jgi:hypothetical protein